MKHRIFIGIPLPASQSPLISQAQSSLGGLKVQLQWEPLEKIHLTLNFLGHIEEAILHTIMDAALEAEKKERLEIMAELGIEKADE